jgi:hypothetical protein
MVRGVSLCIFSSLCEFAFALFLSIHFQQISRYLEYFFPRGA